jgi:hypothetical protein
MRIKLETTLDYFLFFIIFIKIIFAISYFGDVISKHTNNYLINDILDPRFIYWKERTEFIFIACMSILLIYHFNPRNPVPVPKDTNILFFIFGLILLFTANWSLFFEEAKWHNLLSQLLR